MNKALRFVWLSLLTLICGVASAGTVVFDPTQASDVTTGGGTTITKNGITLAITKQNPSWPISFDATKQDGKVCYTLYQGSRIEITPDASLGNIIAITCEYFNTGSGGIYEMTKYGTIVPNGQRYEFANGGLRAIPLQPYYGSVFLTKLTVEYDGGEDPGPGPGGDVEQTTTIGQLMQGGVNVTSANIKFTNAQVVYAEGNNYIVRENNQAIDIMNSSLALSQGDKLNGTVKLNVTYKNGILTTTDISGSTNSDKLISTPSGSTDYDPIHCATVADMLKYPGDLLVVENATYDGYNGYCADRKRYFTISNATDVVPYQKYDMTVWFNNVLYTNPKVKIVKLEPVITSLDAPAITGETSFEESTTVTINSDKNVATIYYTTNGDEPTTSSTPYNGPFTLTETTTVKAIAVYKSITSDVATMTFEKFDANAPRTIADLASIKTDLASVTVSFVNARVVYGEDNNFILRENIDGKYYALDVLNTQLPFKIGATVSGTVKLKVAFKANPAENNGVLSTADVTETLNHNLTITPGTSVMPIPLEVPLLEVRNYPGDLLVVKDGKWDPSINGIYEYEPSTTGWGHGAEHDV